MFRDNVRALEPACRVTGVANPWLLIASHIKTWRACATAAERLDGANGAQQLRYVVLPAIMPVFLMITTITLLGGFSVFEYIFVMTGGGPAGATDVLGTYAYSSAFELNRISYGTALALAISVMAIPFAVGLNRLQRRLSLEGSAA